MGYEQKKYNPRSHPQPSCSHDGKQPEEKANTPKMSEQRDREMPMVQSTINFLNNDKF